MSPLPEPFLAVPLPEPFLAMSPLPDPFLAVSPLPDPLPLAVSPLPDPEPFLTFSEAWATEIVGAVTAHGFSLVHMVLSEATNTPFETKSVTPEASSEALPAKIAVI